jgi:hypothetical protein
MSKNNFAFCNINFLTSPEARVIRILSEYLEPKQRLETLNIENTIVFFGSARIKSKEELNELRRNNKISEKEFNKFIKFSKYYDAAKELSKKLSKWNYELDHKKKKFIIATGGGPGIMMAANKGAYEAGQFSIGFSISLPFEEKPNPYLKPEHSFDFHYFFTRKFWFAYLAKVLVIFPGGFGTLDELFELLALIQTKKIKKPIKVILFGSEFWKEIINFDKLVDYGVISNNDLELFEFQDNVENTFISITNFLHNNYLK